MNALVQVGMGDMERMAEAAAKSGMFGFKTREQVLTIMAVAQAEGLHPARALQEYEIVQGRPTLRSAAMLARFQAAGGKVRWVKSTDKECEAVFSHPAGGELSVRWDMARAASAGLAGKPNWKQYPAQMLRARCITEGVRAVFPGCIGGFYAPEEVADMVPAGEARPSGGVTSEDIAMANIAAEADPVAAVREAESLPALKAAFSAAAAEAKRRGDDGLLAEVVAAKDQRKIELEAIDAEVA